MARTPDTAESMIARWRAYMVAEQYYSPRSIRYYCEQARCVFSIIDDQIAPGAIPTTVTRQNAMDLYAFLRDHHYAVKTQKGYICTLKLICAHFGNELGQLRIPFACDVRPRAQWLDSDQARALLRVPKTPIQAVIVWLELCHGLRRCEIIRLRVQDVSGGVINVTGKGRGGGKLRTIPMHPDFVPVLARWMSEREDIIRTIRKTVPDISIPDALIIWGRGRQLSAFSEVKGSGIDDQIAPLQSILGFRFSNHVLRRTFGREMYYSGVSVETIARLLGHSQTTTTLEYIGISIDNMTEAMSEFKLTK